MKLKKARPFYREKYCVPPEQQNAYESSAVMLGVEYILSAGRSSSPSTTGTELINAAPRASATFWKFSRFT